MADPGSPVLGPEPDDLNSNIPLSAVLARIRSQRNSALANQRMPAAVLAALDDSIRDSGEEQSPGAYWAGLVGVLDRVANGGDAETLAAVVYLLAAVFPRWAVFLLWRVRLHF